MLAVVTVLFVEVWVPAAAARVFQLDTCLYSGGGVASSYQATKLVVSWWWVGSFKLPKLVIQACAGQPSMVVWGLRV
jgi:hypothetical protein